MVVDLNTYRSSLNRPSRRRGGRHLPCASASAPTSPLKRVCFQVTEGDPGCSRSLIPQETELAVQSCPVSPASRSKHSKPPPSHSSVASADHFRDTSPYHRPESRGNGYGAGNGTVVESLTLPEDCPVPSPTASSPHLSVDTPSTTDYDTGHSHKRRRPKHDVDGPDTSHLSSKKRRIRYQLITSRLSQPYSLPATHILNRESGEEAPILSRFLKLAILRAKKAGHETALVRKAAIMNRIRLSVRQAAVNRGHERMWRLSDTSVMTHGLQVVTASTGAMFPGRGEEQAPMPVGWRPHTTLHVSPPEQQAGIPSSASVTSPRAPPAPRLSPLRSPSLSPPRATSQIMSPLPGAEGDTPAFPSSDADSRYADLSDEDMDDVYADFGVLFGGSREDEGARGEHGDQEQFYEEFMDELDGIPWVD